MAMAKNSIRTKTYYCGTKRPEYIEIDLFPCLEQERRYGRKGKEKLTAPKQRNLNAKRAKRYFCLLLKTNFTEGDIHVTLTYNAKFLPETIEQAEREVKNYLRRIANARKRKGLPALKYIYITEQGVQSQRIHHHLIINSGLSRDEIEMLWRRPKRKGEKYGQALGDCNADRLRVDDKGLERLAAYLSKDPKGRKRWTPSQNLKKPQISVSDTKTTRKKFQQLILLPVDCEVVKDYFEKQHPGYVLTECRKEFNDITGQWAIYVKMRLRI